MLVSLSKFFFRSGCNNVKTRDQIRFLTLWIWKRILKGSKCWLFSSQKSRFFACSFFHFFFAIFSLPNGTTSESRTALYKISSSIGNTAIRPCFSETVFCIITRTILHHLPKRASQKVDPSSQSIEAITFWACILKHIIPTCSSSQFSLNFQRLQKSPSYDCSREFAFADSVDRMGRMMFLRE